MDQNLLDALNNVSASLEELVDAINRKKESQSSVSQAIKSGNFSQSLQTISAEIKSVKKDTEKILENQETIISISKEKEKEKKDPIKSAGTKDQIDAIKKGAGSILLIAGAVLAIGTAFNMVGNVDALSVISLSLAITTIAIAFEKVASLNLGIESATIAVGTIVAISVGILLSSIALSYVRQVSIPQLLTSIAIAATFGVIAKGVSSLITSFKGMSTKELLVASISIPIILPAIALGIAGASYGLKLVEPINLQQFFSSIMIGAIFTVLSFGIPFILRGFKDLNESKAVTSAFIIPIMFTAMSLAILGSSKILSNVEPIGISQFFTSLGIALLFVPIGYALAPIIPMIGGLEIKDLFKLPLAFTVMSTAIWVSSYILSNMDQMSAGQIMQAIILGTGLSLMTIALVPAFRLIGNIPITQLLKGGLAVLVIATSIALSSQILSFGDYSEYPDVDWSLGVGLSLAAFGAGAVALGLFVAGPQAVIFLAGIGAVLGVAGTIVGVSKILKNGNYDNPGMLNWAKSTALLYATFAPVMLILGTAALASSVLSVFGADPWKKAQSAMIDVADSIVAVSFRLKDGDYSGGPSENWSKGIGLSIGAFAPVYEVLAANSRWLSSGVSVSDMKSAIMTISQGIVDSAYFFAKNTASFDEGKFPSINWSKGVGSALGAFAPVFEALSGKSWYKSSGSVIKNMTDGISAISSSLLLSAMAFSGMSYDSQSGKWTKMDEFDGVWSNFPTTSWSSGVSKSVISFLDLFDELEDRGYSTASFARNSRNLNVAANSMTSLAKQISINKDFFNSNINPNFIKGVASNMMDFTDLVNHLVESESQGKTLLGKITNSVLGDPVSQVADRMITLAKGYDALAESLTGLGLAMRTLNVTDVKDLGGITTKIVTPIIESGQISTRSDFSDKILSSTSQTSVNTGFTNEINQSNSEIVSKLDTMIEILSNIERSAGSLDSLMNEYTSMESDKSSDLEKSSGFFQFFK